MPRGSTITPQKVRKIIEGARDAGREVESFEIEGIVVRLAGQNKEAPTGRGHDVKWSSE